MKILKPQQLIPLLDLTSLNETDNQKSISDLCQQAISPFGSVAAVCVYPKFVKQVHNQLAQTNIQIATVVNFPHGNNPISVSTAEITQAIADGATEIDAVMPYQPFLSGNHQSVIEFIQACRTSCPSPIKLKIILETGIFNDLEQITAAASLAIENGADFIKTSTGKILIGATTEAVQAILIAIQEKLTDKNVGIKVAGGIRTIAQASEYWYLVAKTMGEAWIQAKNFRFGSSRLLID